MMNEDIQHLDCPAEVDGPATEAAPDTSLPGEAETADPAGAEGAPSADPRAEAPDADPGAVPDARAQLSKLREELTQLREELSRKEAVSLRLGRECAEFRELYPEVPLSEIPDAVWDAVRDGTPLSAAYALAERRRARREAAAAEANRRNGERSSGEMVQHTPGYFSRDEVLRMSRAEVRENYGNILLSMQKWN